MCKALFLSVFHVPGYPNATNLSEEVPYVMEKVSSIYSFRPWNFSSKDYLMCVEY